MKQETRRLAKRQLTWFRANREVRWFHPEQRSEIIEAAQEISFKLEASMNLKRSLSYLIMLPAWIFLISQSYPAEAKLDWKALEDEAVAILSRYIQIDTTNPPGNELKAAEFLKGDIGARRHRSAPYRVGAGTGKYLCPAQRQRSEESRSC